jgi:hypothetical protein
MNQTRNNAREQIEHQVTSGAHPIFDIVTENVECPHVADQVKPASMKKHGCEKGEQA